MFSTTIHEIVYLEVSPDDGSHFLTTLNYIWTYSVNESVEHDIIEIKQPEETPSNILIIDEEKLNVSSTYVISVTGWCSLIFILFGIYINLILPSVFAIEDSVYVLYVLHINPYHIMP